jgi:hypothetical protein
MSVRGGYPRRRCWRLRSDSARRVRPGHDEHVTRTSLALGLPATAAGEVAGGGRSPSVPAGGAT